MRQGRSPRAFEGTSRPGEVSSGPSPRVGQSRVDPRRFKGQSAPPFYSYLLLTLSNPIVEHVGVTSHPSTGSASRIPIPVRSGSAARCSAGLASAPPSAAWPGMRHRRACGRPVRHAYALVSCSNLFAAHLHATCPATDACRLFGFCAFPLTVRFSGLSARRSSVPHPAARAPAYGHEGCRMRRLRVTPHENRKRNPICDD